MAESENKSKLKTDSLTIDPASNLYLDTETYEIYSPSSAFVTKENTGFTKCLIMVMQVLCAFYMIAGVLVLINGEDSSEFGYWLIVIGMVGYFGARRVSRGLLVAVVLTSVLKGLLALGRHFDEDVNIRFYEVLMHIPIVCLGSFLFLFAVSASDHEKQQAMKGDFW